MQCFGLSQPVIERMVDRFTMDHSPGDLPECRVQRVGDAAIDLYLDHAGSRDRLPAYVARFSGVPEDE